MIASRSDIQPKPSMAPGGVWALFLALGLLAAPAAAGSTGLGASVVPTSLLSELATESLLFQQQTRARTGTSQPVASRGSSRPRTGGASYRGGGHGYRGHSYYRGSRRHYPYYRYSRRHYPFYAYSYPFYSSWYWWGRPIYYGYRIAEDYLGGEAGALDLDVKPEKAEVWVDGEYVGIADNFDGFPRYLWLPKGDHRLVFFLEGYKTAAREFSVGGGVVLRVKTKLDRGESKPAQEFFPKSSERAEARQKADDERRAPWRYENREGADESVEPRAEPRGGDEPWRQERARESADFRSEPARLVLTITPSDAVAYLDGRLLGSGEELSRLHSALLIDVGEHLLEITRPGYESEAINFTAGAEKDVELDVDLNKQD